MDPSLQGQGDYVERLTAFLKDNASTLEEAKGHISTKNCDNIVKVIRDLESLLTSAPQQKLTAEKVGSKGLDILPREHSLVDSGNRLLREIKNNPELKNLFTQSPSTLANVHAPEAALRAGMKYLESFISAPDKPYEINVVPCWTVTRQHTGDREEWRLVIDLGHRNATEILIPEELIASIRTEDQLFDALKRLTPSDMPFICSQKNHLSEIRQRVSFFKVPSAEGPIPAFNPEEATMAEGTFPLSPRPFPDTLPEKCQAKPDIDRFNQFLNVQPWSAATKETVRKLASQIPTISMEDLKRALYACTEFLNTILGDQPCTIDYYSWDKSNRWIAELALPFMKTKPLFAFPGGDLLPSEEISMNNVILFDDAAYTGTQMRDEVHEAVIPLAAQIHVIIPFSSEQAQMKMAKLMRIWGSQRGVHCNFITSERKITPIGQDLSAGDLINLAEIGVDPAEFMNIALPQWTVPDVFFNPVYWFSRGYPPRMTPIYKDPEQQPEPKRRKV